MIINPSLACANPYNMQVDLQELVEADCKWIHIDLMDGHYVPNISINFAQMHAVNEHTPFNMDVHLMVTNPFDYVERVRDTGAKACCFHLDATNFPHRLLTYIREQGMLAGVVLNPAQRISELDLVLDSLDYVLLMSVDPGFNGQTFKDFTISKIAELARIRKERGLDFKIMVDGGLDKDLKAICHEAGADILVGGVFSVFNQEAGIKESFLECEAYVRSHSTRLEESNNKWLL